MKFASLRKAFVTASILIAVGHSGLASAHEYRDILIGNGSTDTGSSDLVAVICDPGTDYLEAQIKDKSSPEPGLMLNVHIAKGAQMKTVADTVSGDNTYSPFIRVNGGSGLYYMAATTTKVGTRLFDLNYHCKANDGTHPESSVQIYQVE